MISNEAVGRALAVLAPRTPFIESKIEVTDDVERLVMRSREVPHRHATVSRADLTQYTLLLDGG